MAIRGPTQGRIQRIFGDTIFGNGNFYLPTPWLPGDKKITSFWNLRWSKNLFSGVKHITLVPYKTLTEPE